MILSQRQKSKSNQQMMCVQERTDDVCRLMIWSQSIEALGVMIDKFDFEEL